MSPGYFRNKLNERTDRILEIIEQNWPSVINTNQRNVTAGSKYRALWIDSKTHGSPEHLKPCLPRLYHSPPTHLGSTEVASYIRGRDPSIISQFEQLLHRTVEVPRGQVSRISRTNNHLLGACIKAHDGHAHARLDILERLG